MGKSKFGICNLRILCYGFKARLTGGAMSDLKNELKKLGVNMLITIPVIITVMIILVISYPAGYVCAAASSGFLRGFHKFVRDTEKIGDSNEC
jgi:hypothetical protein